MGCSSINREYLGFSNNSQKNEKNYLQSNTSIGIGLRLRQNISEFHVKFPNYSKIFYILKVFEKFHIILLY